MNVILEKVEKGEAYFQFTIEAKKFEDCLKKAYKKNVKNYNIPGFRKGNVPQDILEAKLGANIFYADALDLVVPDEYYAAIKELELTPFGDPDIEVGNIEKGKPLSVKVVVPLQPEVKLGKIEGLEIKVAKTKEVTELDIEKYIEDLRTRHRKVIDKSEEPAALGDTVTVDYKCTVEDTDYGTVENYKLALNPDSFILGFEDQLIGAKKGESRHIEKEFPVEHAVMQLAGKTAHFEVEVKSVEFIELRELNDQFALEIAKVNNLEELRLDAKNKLLQMTSERATTSKKQAIIKALLDVSEVSVPDFLVMQQAKAMLEDFQNGLTSQGGSLDLYVQMNNTSTEVLKKQIWDDAKIITQSNYILDKIIREKGIEVSEEEFNKGIEAFAISINMDPENARENLGPLVDKVLFDLKADKAVQYLLDCAVLSNEEVS
jgi:trigger factor